MTWRVVKCTSETRPSGYGCSWTLSSQDTLAPVRCYQGRAPAVCYEGLYGNLRSGSVLGRKLALSLVAIKTKIKVVPTR
jgi:hypothetical protein